MWSRSTVPEIGTLRNTVVAESIDAERSEPRRLRHRLAGRPFALAADPQLLDQAARHRRRIPRARRCRRRSSPISSRTSRERGYVGANVTIPHKEAALALSEPDDARARGRRRQHALVRRRHAALDQHRRRGLSRQSRCRGAGLGPRPAERGGARRRRVGARRRVRADRARRCRIHVVNRTPERAQALRTRFGAAVRPARWEEVAPRCSAPPGCWSTPPRSA